MACRLIYESQSETGHDTSGGRTDAPADAGPRPGIPDQTQGLRVWRLRCFRCACYLIQRGERSFLVDTSTVMERRRLMTSLEELGVTALDGILLTHTHTDHVENAAWLEARFGCPVFVHPNGLAPMREGMCILPEGTMLMSRIVSRLANTGLFHWVRFDPCADTRPLTQKALDELLGGNREEHGVTLLETPGHSADSVSLVLGGRAALVGDAMVHTLWGRIYPPYADDQKQVAKDFNALLGTGCEMFYPAHGRGIAASIIRKRVE